MSAETRDRRWQKQNVVNSLHSPMHPCPSCGLQKISRNGCTRHGKQNYKCRDCGRQFVLDPMWQAMTPERYELLERMLLERVSLAGIARVLQISEDTVQH